MIGIDLKSVFKSRKPTTIIETNKKSNTKASNNKEREKEKDVNNISLGISHKQQTQENDKGNNKDFLSNKTISIICNQGSFSYSAYKKRNSLSKPKPASSQKKNVIEKPALTSLTSTTTTTNNEENVNDLKHVIKILKDYINTQKEVFSKSIKKIEEKILKYKEENSSLNSQTVTLIKENNHLKEKILDMVKGIYLFDDKYSYYSSNFIVSYFLYIIMLCF